MDKLDKVYQEMVERGQMITHMGAIFVVILFMIAIYRDFTNVPAWQVSSPAIIKVLLIISSISAVILAKAASQLVFIVLDSRSGFYSRERLIGYNMSVFIRIFFLFIPSLSGLIFTLITNDILWVVLFGLISIYAMFKQWPSIDTVRALYPGSNLQD